jgi:hypothetical protein
MEDATMDTKTPWTHALARATNDPAFRMRLIADPIKALREAGVVVPDGVTVRIHENTDREVHFVLPVLPNDLLDAELERIAAGVRVVQCSRMRSGCGAGD